MAHARLTSDVLLFDKLTGWSVVAFIVLRLEKGAVLSPASQIFFSTHSIFIAKRMQLSAFLGRSKPKRQPEYSATVDRRLFRDLGQAFPFPEAGNRDAFEENLKYFKRELIRVDYSIAWISDSIGPCDIKVKLTYSST